MNIRETEESVNEENERMNLYVGTLKPRKKKWGANQISKHNQEFSKLSLIEKILFNLYMSSGNFEASVQDYLDRVICYSGPGEYWFAEGRVDLIDLIDECKREVLEAKNKLDPRKITYQDKYVVYGRFQIIEFNNGHAYFLTK